MEADHNFVRDPDTSPKRIKLGLSTYFSCCFGSRRREAFETANERPRLIRSSSVWLRSRVQEIPELREKCQNLISRIRRGRKRNLGHLRYDPLSYAMNFDEGEDESQVDDFRYRNFSARLAPTPPTASPGRISMDIACN